MWADDEMLGMVSSLADTAQGKFMHDRWRALWVNEKSRSGDAVPRKYISLTLRILTRRWRTSWRS